MPLGQAGSGVVAALVLSPLILAGQTPQVFDTAAGRHASITVDATNSPRISYFLARDANLKSIWRSGIWYSSTIDNGAHVGEYSSIATSPTPILTFISYYDDDGQRLKLAHQTAAGATAPYTIESLPAPVRLLARSSLALNQFSLTPIIAFFDVNDRNLKLSLFDRGSMFSSPPLSYPGWGVEVVAAAPTNVEDLALVLDAGSEPHLAYIEQSGTTASLRYAHKDCLAAGCLTQITATQQTGEGTWTIETVPGTGMVGSSVALALEPSTNDPLIAYYSGGQLKYAVKSGGTWSIETVPDPSADAGRHVAIALATNGEPHLAYYDAANGDLKHAVRAGGSWTVSTIDGAGADVGQDADIAIGTDDIVHITYYDATNADLKYAGPPRPPQGCCAGAGVTAAVLLIPLLTAGFWRRRLAPERV